MQTLKIKTFIWFIYYYIPEIEADNKPKMDFSGKDLTVSIKQNINKRLNGWIMITNDVFKNLFNFVPGETIKAKKKLKWFYKS